MDSLLKVIDGHFQFGRKEVFHNLSLDLFAGNIYCVLGSNGCGKTTLLRCLNGSLRLDKGQVLLNKIGIADYSIDSLAQKIGMVYQEHNISFPYPVLDVVKMGRSPYLRLFSRPSNRDIKIAEDKLKLVGLYHLKDKPYTQISGGERQLVLIARTLTQEPNIILLDEPTSHLDFKNQVIVLRIINRLAKQGLGILMSTHYPNHALLFSNKVSLMANGKFMATGEPEQVINEKNLKDTYGIKVKIVSSEPMVNGERIKFCIPIENNI
jgi:iron complex transport system ATP-binding protein